MKKTEFFSIALRDGRFIFINQVKLPFIEEYVETESYERIAEAIERLEIRGAPAIGIAAAYGIALALKNSDEPVKDYAQAYKRLYKTRPTAVNLFYALNKMEKIFKESEKNNIYETLLAAAVEIHKDDIERCRRIGENGLKIFKRKSTVITHCNTGKLATGGEGTAFNVIKTGFEKGLVEYVYADETRPLLQGSRLTAYELSKNEIPFSIITDSSSAVLLKNNKIDFAIAGADRIALNGDTANKIGTYNLAVLCYHHDIPFYIAAPMTTIDHNIPSGEDIVVEMRNKKELLEINGNPVSLNDYDAFTPAFDVTPSHLITGIITDEDVFRFPYNFL